MSNRRKQQSPPQPQGMPSNVTFRWSPQWQFEINGGVTLIARGRNGVFHPDGDAIPTENVVEFCNKFQEVLANVIRQRQQAEQPPPAEEEPKS